LLATSALANTAPRSRRAPASSVPASRAAPTPRESDSKPAAPSCAVIATHFVALSMSRFQSAAIARADLVELETAHVEEDCRDERWTPAQRACMAVAKDEIALHACRPAPPKPLYVAAPTPVAGDVDVRCDVVGTHVAELMIDSLEGTDGDNVAARVLVDTDDLPRQRREECGRSKWSDPLRRCFAGATKYDQIVACRRRLDRP
jgi:hypothetical protein